jgi:hypothetical protein
MSMAVSIRRSEGQDAVAMAYITLLLRDSDGQIFESRLSRWKVGLWLRELASLFGE